MEFLALKSGGYFRANINVWNKDARRACKEQLLPPVVMALCRSNLCHFIALSQFPIVNGAGQTLTPIESIPLNWSQSNSTYRCKTGQPILTRDDSYDPRVYVLFGVIKTKINIWPLFPAQNAKFCPKTGQVFLAKNHRNLTCKRSLTASPPISPLGPLDISCAVKKFIRHVCRI